MESRALAPQTATGDVPAYRTPLSPARALVVCVLLVGVGMAVLMSPGLGLAPLVFPATVVTLLVGSVLFFMPTAKSRGARPSPGPTTVRANPDFARRAKPLGALLLAGGAVMFLGFIMLVGGMLLLVLFLRLIEAR